ncbi:MAG: hypothetical protein JSW50_00950, partial [Candidatus Latescibacterota bacterium]
MSQIGKKKRLSLRSSVKGFGFALGGVVGLVFVAVILFLFAPVRHALLSNVLSRAAKSLPGELVIHHASWPAPGRVEFNGVSWVDESDSLVIADRIAVSVDLLGLLKKDIRANEVALGKVYLDIPAVTERFAGDSVSNAVQSDKEGGGGFPRTGSLPGVPSIRIDRMNLLVDSLRISDSLGLSHLVVEGAFDFSYDNPPRVAIDSLAVRGHGGRWEIGSLHLHVDIDKGLLDGEGYGMILPQRTIEFSLASDASDQ